MEHSKQNSAEWWNSRRLPYNLGLVVAGISAFICYLIVLSSVDHRMTSAPGFQRTEEPPEITLFTLGFQAVGYLLMMGVANLCYGLGRLSEELFRPTDTETFRYRVFALGFCFSVFLPFTIPLLLAFTSPR